MSCRSNGCRYDRCNDNSGGGDDDDQGHAWHARCRAGQADRAGAGPHDDPTAPQAGGHLPRRTGALPQHGGRPHGQAAAQPGGLRARRRGRVAGGRVVRRRGAEPRLVPQPPRPPRRRVGRGGRAAPPGAARGAGRAAPRGGLGADRREQAEHGGVPGEDRPRAAGAAARPRGLTLTAARRRERDRAGWRAAVSATAPGGADYSVAPAPAGASSPPAGSADGGASTARLASGSSPRSVGPVIRRNVRRGRARSSTATSSADTPSTRAAVAPLPPGAGPAWRPSTAIAIAAARSSPVW